MRDDDVTLNELSRLRSFVEKCLTGSAVTDDKEKVKNEAKQRFSRVREQLMSKSLLHPLAGWYSSTHCLYGIGQGLMVV